MPKARRILRRLALATIVVGEYLAMAHACAHAAVVPDFIAAPYCNPGEVDFTELTAICTQGLVGGLFGLASVLASSTSRLRNE